MISRDAPRYSEYAKLIMIVSKEARASGCDVLVVEDERLQAREIAESLARAGIKSVMAHDAASAYIQAVACRPRIAIIDCNLPDENGFVVAKKLEELSPQTAIIFMSGHIGGVPEDLLEATRGRIFINKPIPLGPLRQAVLKLLQKMEAGIDHPPEGKRGWLLSGLGSPGGRKGGGRSGGAG